MENGQVKRKRKDKKKKVPVGKFKLSKPKTWQKKH
jgi:hypothetical protein